MIIGNPAMLPELQIEDALGRMKMLGFEGVEISLPLIQACTTDNLKKQFATYVKSHNLTLSCLNTAGSEYFSPLSHPGDAGRIVEGLKQDIDTAVMFGVHHLTTWEGKPHTGLSVADMDGWVLDTTTRLFEKAIEYAREHQVVLSIEVHPKTLGMNVEWLQTLCSRLDPTWFSVTYDCAYFGVTLPEDYIEAIQILGKSIGHLHFCDSDMESEGLHLAPGTGVLDLKRIIETLKSVSFQGTCMLDLGGCLLPIEGARIGVPYLRKAMDFLGIE